MKENILLSGLAGTSLMTLFSYIVSAAEEENFKEPELLAVLEKNALPAGLKRHALPIGWGTHYTMGVAWSTVFEFLWQKTDIKPTVKSGLVLGSLSGLTAILIWKLAFKIHPNPPRINFRKFYTQLLWAHLVYSITVTVTARDRK